MIIYVLLFVLYSIISYDDYYLLLYDDFSITAVRTLWITDKYHHAYVPYVSTISYETSVRTTVQDCYARVIAV